MTEPSAAEVTLLHKDWQLPDLSPHIAHVLATSETNRRHRCGILHVISKSLPQRSIIKAVDRCSAQHMQLAHVRHFLLCVLRALLTPEQFAELNAKSGKQLQLALQGVFKISLIAIRHFICVTVRAVPALRYLAGLYLDIGAFETEVATCVERVRKQLRKRDIKPSSLEPTIVINSIIAGWSISSFTRQALELLSQPSEVHKYATMLHVLHVAFSRGLSLRDSMVWLGVRKSVATDLFAAVGAKRRMRKSKLRETILRSTDFEKTALYLVFNAFRRSKRYCLYKLPFGMLRSHECDDPEFYACSVCCTNRSVVDQQVRASTRVLYDFPTGNLSCGRKSAHALSCADTPLMQLQLRDCVLRVAQHGQTFALCPLCQGFHSHSIHSWRKGVHCCVACKYRIVDDGGMLPECHVCGKPFYKPPFLIQVGDVYVRRRECANGCPHYPVRVASEPSAAQESEQLIEQQI